MSADRSILVINSGSSSLKASLFSKNLERLWDEHFKNIKDPAQELRNLLDRRKMEPRAIAHRVVHGGTLYTKTTRVQGDILDNLRQLSKLAPLHNPACVQGIEAAMKAFPHTPQYAVFDTAFHASIPDHAATYGIPAELSRKHAIKRYGFHGIAHASMMDTFASRHSSEQNLITMQLGNGCSICAIKNGCSIDTSMGFTPMEGLLMSSRCGDLDPGIIDYLCESENIPITGLLDILNKQSGLLGVSGLSSDMKTLLENLDKREVRLAVELFCYRIIKYIGAYTAALKGCDTLVFGGGIGENAPYIREKVLHSFRWAGLHIDTEANNHAKSPEPNALHRITLPDSKIHAYVAGVNENYYIAKEVSFFV